MVHNKLPVAAACILALLVAWIGWCVPSPNSKSNRDHVIVPTRAGVSPVNRVAKQPRHLIPDAEFERHVEELKKQLPHQGFHVIVQKPFVVIGDEALDIVKRRSEQTVKWAVDRLKQEYFRDDPLEIIDVWLFKDKESYQKHHKLLFGSEPTTPFGFYSSSSKALVMNISTGGGTLVHEIVHPFIESNFPNCPSWFNEGLASLYEQCEDKDGKIWGKTNWRLRGLQGVIESGRLKSSCELCSTSSREFYDDDRGSNYAQARYLCYYLQEQGLLRDFYREFRKSVERDPTGYQTLVKTLGNPDMERFDRDWQAYVLKLQY
jgi:hypothetical protein